MNRQQKRGLDPADKGSIASNRYASEKPTVAQDKEPTMLESSDISSLEKLLGVKLDRPVEIRIEAKDLTSVEDKSLVRTFKFDPSSGISRDGFRTSIPGADTSIFW
jgi:hypothetical protein